MQIEQPRMSGSSASSLARMINRRYFWPVVCGVGAATWLAFANLVVPPIIEDAYRGESLSFLNGLIQGRAVHPVDLYLDVWNRFAIRVLASGVVFALLAAVMTTRGFFARCVGAATPGTLGAIRMWTCVVLLITTWWDDLGSIGLLPLEYHGTLGIMKVLHDLPIGFDAFLTSPAGLTAFQRLTELLLLLGVLGWRTRVVIPLCALCTLVMQGILREYTGYWHQNLVPIYVLIALSFTAAGDGWSVDRLRRLYQGLPVPDAQRATPAYGWARYACWVPIALTYTSAGFSKLRADGLGWVSAINVKGLLFEQTLYPRAGNFSISLHLEQAPDFVFVFLGVAAVLGEALFITVLFSRLARRILPGLEILMHIGIVFLMNIVFFDLMLLLLVFYDFSAARERLGRWLRSAGNIAGDGKINVLYDGDCPFCRRTVRVLRGMDLFSRIVFEDFRRADITELSRRHPGLPMAALESEMVVIAAGQAYRGFEGYRRLALVLPVMWPIAPILYLPGALALGKRVYLYVSRHRRAFVTSDLGCPTDIGSEASAGGRVSGPSTFPAWALALAALVAVQTCFWLNSLEFYPFTSVQMFKGKPGTVVTYYKTLGHWVSGRVSPIYLEDTLDVMSINSRYEGLFDLCFGDTDQTALCRKTLMIMGSAYNGKNRSSDKLRRVEIQRWKWDFDSSPRDPQYGALDATFVGDVPPNGVAARRNPVAAVGGRLVP